MKKLKAYSLIEITIYLAIVGILMMFISKGALVFKQAKLQQTALQMNTIQISYQSENNIIQDIENISKEKPAIGGIFSTEMENGETYLILSSKNGSTFLTKTELESIKNKLDKENIIEIEDNNLYKLKYKIS